VEAGMDVNLPFTSLLLIRAEFLEIPRLQLTQTQVEHLWGIDTATASMLLRMLVDTRFLQKVNGNSYVRAN
jgi:Fic family protein